MDFQSAMETFAEAWVAANSGKLALIAAGSSCSPPGIAGITSGTGSGGVVSMGANPLGNGSAELSLAMAGSLIQQQLGKGVVVGSSSNSSSGSGALESTLLSAPAASLDYPKLGSASGMDLSPPSKRLKTVPAAVGGNLKKPFLGAFDGDFLDPNGLFTGQQLSLGKSLPIHCVIEVVNGPGNSGGTGGTGGRERREGNGKSETSSQSTVGSSSSSTLLNERNSPGNGSTNSEGKTIEVDEFVIIPAGTPFQEVVTTVLTLLGYPKDIIQQAVGMISLRNWKPLRLDQICDSPMKTVGDIFNDLTNHVTLRVLVTRAKGGTAEDLKEKLLRLLLAQSSSLLLGSGCPLDEVTLSQLMKGQWPQNLAEDVKRRFDQWYATHFQHRLGSLESLQQQHFQSSTQATLQSSSGASTVARENGLSSPMSSSSSSTHHHHHLVNGANGGSLAAAAAAAAAAASAHHHGIHHEMGNINKSFDDDHSNHPVFHGLQTQKTRMRTSFDPEMELPKLQQWFAENPHPSRHQIQQYVRELNNLDCRKDRKPLDVNNVIYWFKNARAAQKRNELRYNGLAAFPHPLHHHHQSQLSAIHLHNQHNHSISPPIGEDSRDGEEHFRQPHHHLHPHHSIHHRVPRSLDSDEPEGNSREEEEVAFPADNERSTEKAEMEEVAETSIKREEKKEEKEEGEKKIKEEQTDDDYISVDVEMSEGIGNSGSPPECCNNNQPRDLSGKRSFDGEEEKREISPPLSPTSTAQVISGDVLGDEKKRSESRLTPEQHSLQQQQLRHHDNHSTSSSISPRSSPGLSPSHSYDFSGAPSMVGRFPNFFEHPSFMAYRHFNSFNFGGSFPANGNESGSGNGGGGPVGYESALSMVAASRAKGMLTPGGKPSPGLDIFNEFQNGIPILSGNGGGRAGPGLSSGGGDPLSRLRGDDLCSSARSVSSADIISSIINSNRGDLGMNPLNLGGHHHPNANSLAMDERRKRNRTFIDPVTEVPRLEQWFGLNTHPSHNLILKYTDELNRMPYRQKFPKLEPKNVQFWFKNRRAKCKRLKMTL